ncbi:MAG: redoxin domain-containing protein [Chlorobiales bacterium]|jgi:hypothetical protein|nr:redoxin domain-containing protein [Chlorobiales bacterium]
MTALRHLRTSLLTILFVTAAGLSGCISLDLEEPPVIDYVEKPVVISDTFSIVYRPADTTAFSRGPKPQAVLTFKFWEPQFFESGEPETTRISLENYENRYWLGRIIVPKDAVMISYYLTNVPGENPLKTRNYPVLNPKGVIPVKMSYYRIATAMQRSSAPADSVLDMLKKEITLYPGTYDAHILYWSLYYEKHGRTTKALAQIEDEMTALRHEVGDNTDLLQAYALTYIHGIGDRRKAYDVTKDIPDAYLHPINLYNRFLIEPNQDDKEMSWLTMTEEYPGNMLTGKMTLSLLLSYMTNPEIKSERTAILAESIFNKRLSSLRSSGVVSYAVRYLFDYYGSINIEKTMPYVQDVLRIDYERDIYDNITLLQFADDLSASAEYSGISIDIANKALQSLEKDDISLSAESVEKEFLQTAESKRLVTADLKGRAYYAIGKAYLQTGDTQNGLSYLLKAEPLCYSRKADVLLALARAYGNTPRASEYATQLLALEPTDARLSQISRALPKLGKGGSILLSEAAKVRSRESKPVPALKVQALNGQILTEEALRGKIGIIYFWSPNSFISRTFFSNLQLLYSKYRGRGVELISIDTEGKLNDLRENPGDYSYTYPFVTPVSDVVKDFGISYLPSVAVVYNGRIYYQNSAYTPGFIELLEAQIRTLVPNANAKVATDGKTGK